MPRLFKSLVFFLLTLLITFGVLEGYFRWFDDRFYSSSELSGGEYTLSFDQDSIYDWFWKIPEVSDRNWDYQNNTPEFTYLHDYNNGLRNVPLNEERAPNEYRILCLGDSFTEGNGAPQDSTWPALVEQQLQTLADSLEITVINAGFMGSDPFFNYMMLKHRLGWTKPDMVIQAWTENDAMDIISRGGFERFQPDGTVQFRFRTPGWINYYKRSLAFRAVLHGLLKYNIHLRSPKASRADDDFRQDAIDDLLTEYQILAKGNFEFLSIIIPTIYAASEESYKPMTDKDYSVVLHPYLMNRIDREGLELENYYWPMDRHFNSRGYKILAKSICQAMADDEQICIPLDICESGF